MIRSVTSVIRKNLVVLLRARASALIIVLGPLLVILLAGLAFDNTNTYAVKIGAFSSSFNALSNSFVDRLAENQFAVQRYTSEAECTGAVRSGDVHLCVVLSPDFTLAKSLRNDVTFHVDYSRINLVWTLLEVMTSRVAGGSQDLSLNLTNVLLKAMSDAREEITQSKANIRSYADLDEKSRGIILGAEDELEALDLEPRLDDATVKNITAVNKKVEYWFAALSNLADKSLSQAGTGLRVAEQAAGDNPNVTAPLKDARRKLEILRGEVTNVSSGVTKDTDHFKSLAGSLELQILQTKKQLGLAREGRTLAIEKIDEINATLDLAMVEVLSVKRAMTNAERILSTIEVTDPNSIVQPVRTVIKPVAVQSTYLNYVFPVLIVLMIMFTGLLVAPMLILLDKASPASFRNALSPSGPMVFEIATFLTSFLLLAVQSSVILGIAAMFFESQISASAGVSSLLLLVLATLFILAGMVIGHVFRTEETATLAAITIGSALLFISDVILPVESMPALLRELASYNPFMVGSTLLRRAMLFGASIDSLLVGIILLLKITGILLLVLLFVEWFANSHAAAKIGRAIAVLWQKVRKH